MAALAHTRPVPPPTPQEIQRKLSTSRPPKLPIVPPPPTFSGTESDSDSLLSPEAGSPPAPSLLTPASQAPLSAIVERPFASGEETDEEDDDEEGWHAANPAIPRSDHSNVGGESVQISGYLSKKGIRRKNWKKRWFVLRPPHLAYYKSSAEYKLLRLLDLHEVHSVTSCSLKNHTNTFGVVSPNRTFYLQADSHEEMQSWVQALNEARITLQSTTTVTSAQQASAPPPPRPIAIPGPATPRAANFGSVPSPITPSPPTHQHMHHITSSDSDDGSPTALHPATQLSGSASLPRGIIPASNQDPSKVLLAGYLMKCSSKRKSWRKRWFTLSGEKLVYSGSHMDTRPHRMIPLTEILDALEFRLPVKQHALSPQTASPPAPSQGEDADDKHTFKVITPKRTLLLCAPSEEEEIKWLSAIQALIARRSGGGGAGGGAQAPSEAGPRKKEGERRSVAGGLTGGTEGGSGTG